MTNLSPGPNINSIMKNFLLTIAFLFITSLATTTFAQETKLVDIDQKFTEMGFNFMEQSKPGAIFKRVVVVDNMAYTAGHISIAADGKIMVGKVGQDVEVEQAAQAAERSAVAMLSSLKAELGSLNRIKRIVKTTGMVNCTDEFTQQSQVVNGFSQVFKNLWGEENGVGARSAVGMSSLPAGAIVEVEAIFELNDE